MVGWLVFSRLESINKSIDKLHRAVLDRTVLTPPHFTGLYLCSIASYRIVSFCIALYSTLLWTGENTPNHFPAVPSQGNRGYHRPLPDHLPPLGSVQLVQRNDQVGALHALSEAARVQRRGTAPPKTGSGTALYRIRRYSHHLRDGQGTGPGVVFSAHQVSLFSAGRGAQDQGTRDDHFQNGAQIPRRKPFAADGDSPTEQSGGVVVPPELFVPGSLHRFGSLSQTL
mmetsp:Transcript_27780/g.58235  ORF Transcript_27780/g.58235 Transcript_27780/m.58235 type:complete len:227 (-) Transcript_27780:2304-2984(-)